MASLAIEGVSKSFGRTQALKNVSLEINDGEFVVLLGPTAAGKTTTLRCVAGLEKLDSGNVRIDGEVVNKQSAAERDLAMVFQTYALYPRKTAYENMAFPLYPRGMSKTDIDKRVREIAELLQITELLDRRPSAMSGGQQQRVALGRAMVRQPRVFLMDEPLTNLDFKLRVEMRAELKRLQRELDTTFFYVTNDQVEAMSMADRIVVLNHGEVQQIGTPEGIYDNPANLFVAQFVGSPRINTMKTTLEADKLVSVDGLWSVSLTEAQQDAIQKHNSKSKWTYGIRSEDITLSLTPVDGAIKGEIFVIEPLGDRSYVDVQLGEQLIKVRADPDFEAFSDDAVWLTFDNDRAHLFDIDSEEAVF